MDIVVDEFVPTDSPPSAVTNGVNLSDVGNSSPVMKRRRRVQINRVCINPNCNSSGPMHNHGLVTARNYELGHFGVKPDPRKKRKICRKCLQEVEAEILLMKNRLESNQLIIEGGFKRQTEKTFTLEESDKESETDSSDESEFELELAKDLTGSEMNLKKIINTVLEDKNVIQQVKCTISHLGQRMDGLLSEAQAVDEDLENIQNAADKIIKDLYRPFQVVDPENEAPSLACIVDQNLNSVLEPCIASDGDLKCPLLSVGDKVFSVKNGLLDTWIEAEIVEVLEKDGEHSYKLRFQQSHDSDDTSEERPLSHVAYIDPPQINLKVGTRVIALYEDTDYSAFSGLFFVGIIAETPQKLNKYRLLVFFDDGYASYVTQEDVRVVCKQNELNKWLLVHEFNREFVRKYLQQYPCVPMAALSKGQLVKTEWRGCWWISRVEDVDASLAKILFFVDDHTEVIHCGSSRLAPVNEPSRSKVGACKVNLFKGMRHAVARKSASSSSKKFQRRPPSEQPRSQENKGTVKNVSLDDKVEGAPYVLHECSPACLTSSVGDSRFQYDEKVFKGMNPLLIPLRLGWQREMTKHKNGSRRHVYYVTPCGRRLRNLDDIHRYLRITESSLEIDFFDMSWHVHVLHEFEPEHQFQKIDDVSYGKENIPVSCVNSIDNTFPDYVEYSTVRLPQKGVNINLDDEFLICCDCTDDCQDKERCACWQLTLSSVPKINENQEQTSVDQIGYKYRRLLDPVSTGIYECNHKCKCKQTCLNRVAQNPLRLKLQLFKTEKRGWGLRTLCDIPRGTFICVYVGNLYTNQEANVRGLQDGDEYFAELDLIEIIERQKEGYESDVDFSDVDDDDVIIEAPNDEGDKVASKPTSDTSEETAEQKENDSGEPNLDSSLKPTNTSRNHQRFTSTRKFFAKDDERYIMDAKLIGNIGRYMNHSCNPNVFVQNCFVDTHDLRFPWVAFFAYNYIPAGHELCWDYNYIVDEVQGKEIFCHCGFEGCRGRLL